MTTTHTSVSAAYYELVQPSLYAPELDAGQRFFENMTSELKKKFLSRNYLIIQTLFIII